MAQEMEKLEELNVPGSGIGAFIMEDDEIEAVYGGGAKLSDSEGGIIQLPEAAQKMAAMGRYGDNIIAHLESGEMVIPVALLEKDEALKEGIFQRLRDMGVEDPNRYVAGSDANSINPATGIAEFFLDKIAKGIRGIRDKLAGVLKKVAAPVLSFVLTPILGPIYGAALGSGIGTLIQGGSVQDALKSGFTAGLTGAVYQGFTGNQGGFMKNIQAGLANPGQRFAALGSATRTTAGNIFGGAQARAANAGQRGLFDRTPFVPQSQRELVAYRDSATEALSPTEAQVAQATVEDLTITPEPSEGLLRKMGRGISDVFNPQPSAARGLAAGQRELANIQSQTQLIEQMNAANPSLNLPAPFTPAEITSRVSQAVTSAATPNMFQKAVPYVAGGLGIMGATGMFETPEVGSAGLVDETTGEDLIKLDPSKYLVSEIGGQVLDPTTGQYVPAPTSPFNTGYYSRPLFAADGGAIFPRRNGGIMPDEGIPGQDSVRAMLMPGEFVMTTDAVRGLGNGDLNDGIKNMYSVMRNLESRGRAMA